MGRLVDVHGAGEPQVRRQLDRVTGCQVEPSDALARAHLHRRQEPREVVLDASEVHLVEDHVELARRAPGEVGGGPLPCGLLDELAERRVVVEAVERGEVAEQVFVRGPARVDRSELRTGADRVGVGLSEPRLARAARAREDHEPAGLHRQVVATDDIVTDQEPWVLLTEPSDHLVEQRPGDRLIGRALGLSHRVAHAPASHAPTSGGRSARHAQGVSACGGPD